MMTDIFDKNGNAKTTSVVTVYGVTPESGEFSGAYDVRIIAGTGIPGLSTLVAPPELEQGKGVLLVGDAWELVTDNRGKKAFSCASGAESVIDYLGDIREGFTLSPPSTPYDSWDGDKWITDAAKQRTTEIAAAEAEKSRLYAMASEKITPLKDALDGGFIEESDKDVLTAWQKYRYDLTKVDTSVTPAEFPAVPA
ncbi:tail fiber assembly protein [Erwinia rhapontici]|uniref:tail fiber assembly protein n=1 Tax=Erwinia rhapontici TaxID=55212 RepID=UPI003B9E6197